MMRQLSLSVLVFSFITFDAQAADIDFSVCNGPRIQESIRSCGEILQLDTSAKQRSRAYINIAIRLMSQMKLDEAISDFNNSILIEPENSLTYVMRATAQLKSGHRLKAQEDLKQSLKLNPKQAEAYTSLSLLDYQGGILDDAIKDANMSIDLDSRQQAAYNNRGAAYRDKGQYDKAIIDFNVVIRMNPQAARSFYNRGLTYQRMGDKEKALKDFETALAIDPNDQDAAAGRDRLKPMAPQTTTPAKSVAQIAQDDER